MRSAADILSISTGRETILIGPLSSFGAEAAKTVLRERHSIFQVLQLFASRPNAEERLRPYLRRWGLDTVSIRATTRHSLVDALARAAATGAIGVARIPDVTLTFAAASLDDDVTKAKPAQAEGPHLPPDLADRMVIVFSMAPDYMEGETKLAFEEAVKSLGMPVIVGGVCAWIGAHFIPGVNIAMLAFDLFFLSAEVLHALEKAAEIIEDVRLAKSRKQLEPAARALATVLAILIVNGVLNRLLKAKILTKGVGKKGGLAEGKPAPPPRRGRKGAPDQVRKAGIANEPASPSALPKKSPFLPKKLGQAEPGVVPMTPELRREINGAARVRTKGNMEADGWPTLRGQERGTFSRDPQPVELEPGTKIYRVIDSESNPNGAFWSLTPPPAKEEAWRSGAAVLNDWNGDGAYVEHTVGTEGLRGWMGPARAQLSSDGTSALTGGADQFVIPPNSVAGPLVPKPTPWNQ